MAVVVVVHKRGEKHTERITSSTNDAGVSGGPSNHRPECVTNARLRSGFAAPGRGSFEGRGGAGRGMLYVSAEARMGFETVVAKRIWSLEGFGEHFLHHHAGRRLLEELSDTVGPPKRYPAGPLLPRYRNS
jgi:hypothetical protein